MTNLERFLNYLEQFTRIPVEDLRQYIYKFNLEDEEAINEIKKLGWELEDRPKKQLVWWSPNVTDRNSMITHTDAKQPKISDKPIVFRREKR